MALRRTADRVDDQVVDYLKQNAIDDAWQTAERLLVCIGPDELSEKVVRTAARLAVGLNAPWLVMTVDRPDRPAPASEIAQAVESHLKLAASLGAETRRVAGNDFVEEILKAARREHATQIVIGARRPSLPGRLLHKSLPDALIDSVSGIGIHVVTEVAVSRMPASTKIAPRRWLKNPLLELGVPFGAVALSTLVGLTIDQIINLPNISLVYLLAVVVSAVYGVSGSVGRSHLVSACL
jgi:two-component system sensor histidine kinase KdpD